MHRHPYVSAIFTLLSKGQIVLLLKPICKGGGLMKYFILYVTFKDHSTDEIYLKGKSLDHLEERIERYANGCLAISKGSIYTSNAKSAFIREINLRDFPHFTKNDFALINETSSYDESDLNGM